MDEVQKPISLMLTGLSTDASGVCMELNLQEKRCEGPYLIVVAQKTDE
jgi:hypothetical protein